MKKLFSILLIIAIVFSCCACGGNQPSVSGQETEPTAPVVKVPTVEERYADVDEFTPNKTGYYTVYSAQGLLAAVKKMDANIQLLRDIDLGGMEWTPIGTKDAPFTGKLYGQGFSISNFTVSKPNADGDQGFFGVNAGKVRELTLKNVTVTTTESTRRVGLFAACNADTIQNCNAIGSIRAEKLADGALCGGFVGENTTGLYSVCSNVDLTCSATGSAKVGGIVGSMTKGTMSYCQTEGELNVSGKNKTVGQLIGEVTDADVLRCAFMGLQSRLNDQTVSAFFGKATNTEAENCSRIDASREELDPQLRAIRDKVVQRMYEMGTVAWTVNEKYSTKCFEDCTLSGCITPKMPGIQYYGFPYGHNTCSLERFMYCIDENGVVKDWVIDLNTTGGMPDYMASDCLRSVQMAWITVANSVNTGSCMNFVHFSSAVGAIQLGDLPAYTQADTLLATNDYVKRVGEQAVYEAYTHMWAGDALVRVDSNGSGHGMMAATDPVVVRFEDGTIDPEHSYVLIHEQGRSTKSTEFVTTWSINRKSTFYELMFGDDQAFLPYTIRELQEGETDIPEATLEGGMDGIYGLCMGTVKSNFFLDSVTVVITDSKGDQVFSKTMFSRIDNVGDFTDTDMFERMLTMEFDMGNFSSYVMAMEWDGNETYHATVTANLHTGDHIVVKDYTF